MSTEEQITEEYLEYQKKYEEKYGFNTVVLMQIGNFYETFEYDPLEDNTSDKKYNRKIGCAREIASVLNITITSKNKRYPHTVRNPHMAGFQIMSIEENKKTLLLNGYRVIILDQVKKETKSKKREERVISEILSPTTELNNISILPTTNNIVSIYIDCQRTNIKLDQYIILCGLSCIDVSTGKSIVSETYSKESDNFYAIQEIYRFLITQQPKDIILHVQRCDERYIDYLKEALELDRFNNVILNHDELNKEYLKINYQESFLNKIFERTSGLSIIEELDLENLHYGRISYLVLFQFCYDQNEIVLNKIQRPETKWIDSERNLILTFNAINQLNLISTDKRSKKNSSLFNVIDQTSTNLGRRRLQNILLSPITNMEQLERTYDIVEELIQNKNLLNTIEKYLKKIPDIERYQRKLSLKIIQPLELNTLLEAYYQIKNLYSEIHGQDLKLNQEIKISKFEKFEECLNQITQMVDLTQLSNFKIKKRILTTENNAEDTFIYSESDAKVDQYVKTVIESKIKLTQICEHLNSFISRNSKPVILNSKEKKSSDEEESIYLETTVATTNTLKKNYNSINKELCGEIEFKTFTKTAYITSKTINKYCNQLEEIKSKLSQYLYQKYVELIDWINKFNFFQDLNFFISNLDLFKSHAKTSLKFNYYKPQINKEEKESFINAKDLRHPIIERLINEEYIPNDIELGETQYGMLLFGINSSGKSSLTKAIGLNLILAQSGCFTAGKIEFYPYNRIITRLSGHDDIFKGHSSFIVEMMELRTILRNADSKTLVLGDELCRGTEILSGTSLTISTILTLLERGTSFVFSTHMHHLPDCEYIKNTNKLRICHLNTYYDEELKCLVYERKLQEGQGNSTYGLEVAKSVDLDSEFIRRTNEIRNSFKNYREIFRTKKSKYNSNVYIDQCFVCGVNNNLETHHIKPQSEANSNRFINYHHKNAKFNLIALCRKCHQWIHQHKYELEKKTTNYGPKIKIKSKT